LFHGDIFEFVRNSKFNGVHDKIVKVKGKR
jgi:hypothetical protein